MLAPLADVVAPGRAEYDLERPETLRALVRALRPHIIVNAAAYTAVDRAEEDADRARAVNAVAPAALAQLAVETGALLIHYSTDFVFDGQSRQPYREGDRTAPLNVYGATKLEGERAICESGAAHLILRTSWVYGLRGKNFFRTVLRLARQRDELRVVDDQFGAPTWSRMIGAGTAHILARVSADHGSITQADCSLIPSGVYHLAASGEATWHEFAEAILAGDPARAEHRCTALTPISSAEYSAPAQRPPYSVLDCSRVLEQFGVQLPTWQKQLELLLEDARSAE